MANLEQELINARELVAKFDKLSIAINCLTLFDLGYHDGYAAMFDFDLTADSADFAAEFPRSAKGITAAEAIQKAITKCEAELSAHVKKNFRYSPEIQKEFCKV